MRTIQAQATTASDPITLSSSSAPDTPIHAEHPPGSTPPTSTTSFVLDRSSSVLKCVREFPHAFVRRSTSTPRPPKVDEPPGEYLDESQYGSEYRETQVPMSAMLRDISKDDTPVPHRPPAELIDRYRRIGAYERLNPSVSSSPAPESPLVARAPLHSPSPEATSNNSETLPVLRLTPRTRAFVDGALPTASRSLQKPHSPDQSQKANKADASAALESSQKQSRPCPRANNLSGRESKSTLVGAATPFKFSSSRSGSDVSDRELCPPSASVSPQKPDCTAEDEYIEETQFPHLLMTPWPTHNERKLDPGRLGNVQSYADLQESYKLAIPWQDDETEAQAQQKSDAPVDTESISHQVNADLPRLTKRPSFFARVKQAWVGARPDPPRQSNLDSFFESSRKRKALEAAAETGRLTPDDRKAAELVGAALRAKRQRAVTPPATRADYIPSTVMTEELEELKPSPHRIKHLDEKTLTPSRLFQ
ncbi:uncharacterized protein L969DRAFT_55234 [Mixia osmundae IAM 14324]|uniref:Uncharacterized protein n=1 Tax=Mixia osmundae (strain CBS 9802 / IAM 14324 / JCM 22182 / KY 12970) TaxID=764103 RepID=G7DV30_MIXOS|nr:uncharacterized protein L969DRAFT_55234 [Mixia osmundae IAM 14324]KEI36343.1 hypothetical protein L969DRAFT_55234 [Mixia osmundae IAM 14324]GAA94440.1 hypothetical protein E5Q_01092 [Mixia osmundae IAM 14324]